MSQFDDRVIFLKETRFFRLVRELVACFELSRRNKCLIDPALLEMGKKLLGAWEVPLDIFLSLEGVAACFGALFDGERLIENRCICMSRYLARHRLLLGVETALNLDWDTLGIILRIGVTLRRAHQELRG